MDEDGGMSKYSGNKAGAKYGTGYCDAQCPRDLKFINGEANVGAWSGSSNDPNAGVGGHGSCCTEMDIWYVTMLALPVQKWRPLTGHFQGGQLDLDRLHAAPVHDRRPAPLPGR